MSADVITWLRSPAGEQWSRIAHTGGSVDVTAQPPTLWHATGPLIRADDPCGAPPLTVTGKREAHR